MKLNHVFIPAALTCALFSGNVLASDNTITFMGEVTDETCSVSVNGNSSAPIVLLPTVSSSALENATDTAGKTTFDIGVSGCTGSPGGVEISTVFIGNNVSSDTGNLINAGSADNVEIQILDPSDSEIDLRSIYNGAGDLSLGPDETSASSTYSAQYYASGAATAGTVEASLQYAVSYQ